MARTTTCDYLAAGSNTLLRDLKTLGFLFESLVVIDARVYFDPIDGKVYHYRDSDALEVDVIVWTGRA